MSSDTNDTATWMRSALPNFAAPVEVEELLMAVWRSAPELHSCESEHERARAMRHKLGESQMGWESARVRVARQILDGYIAKLEATEFVAMREETTCAPRLLAEVARTDAKFALTFAGQANAYIDELATLYHESFAASQIIGHVAECLMREFRGMQPADRAVYSHGLDVLAWVQSPDKRPSAEYIQMAAVSEALVFLTQVCHYVRLLRSGYDCPKFWNHIGVAAGHSQGIMAALFAAENAGRVDVADRVGNYVVYMLYQGLRMQQAYPRVSISPALVSQVQEANVGDIAPMAMVAGLTTPEIDDIIAELSLDVCVSLENARLRKVVSGRPEELEQLRRAIFDEFDARTKQKSQGRHAGSLVRRDWQYLSVSGPFHSAYMRDGAIAIRDDIARLGFSVDPKALRFAVLDTTTGEDLRNARDLTDRIVKMQFLERVHWDTCVQGIVRADARYVLDFGPGEANCRMTAGNLRGCGVLTLCIATEQGRDIALDENGVPNLPADYRIFAPKLVTMPDGVTRVDNRFTRFTGRSPVFLPGMTPTTVEADIVAAAANKGYVAELAGGGQVTAETLKKRLAELSCKLTPGNGVVFNALYLDPYLWKLHFGGGNLVLKLREEGYPLIGVTVSAGVPPLDEAVQLLQELVRGGLWLNAFKPGTDSQIRQVLEIADAVPDITVCMHIEGGKAGGHHSWEDLQELLVRNYDAIRQRPNVILAVGGGIAREDQAIGYLDGSWSVPLGTPPMPVDAVFLGTIAMATKEAKTSRKVKAALARVSGTTEWILDGQVKGEITSGRSQLDAAIHYIENSATRASRLLDEVSGSPETIEARRAEIIEALEKTAKPYFGDVTDMTYAEFFQRLVELMAIGCGGEYEYGRWLDFTHTARVIEMVRTAEARLFSHNGAEFASMVQSNASLDEPEAFFERFHATYPASVVERVHQDDAAYFIEVCRWAGKPVNFVPVIDADVRKWYKSDSLWQAHHEKYDADQVLAIPGPEAVAGITKIDEPVAALLGRFEAAVVKSLSQSCVSTRELRTSADRQLGLFTAADEAGAITCGTMEALETDRWLERIASLGNGPVVASIIQHDVTVTTLGAATVRLAKNPLRRLMAAREGWTADWRREGGVLRTLTLRDQCGTVVARMRLGSTSGNVTDIEATLVAQNVRDTSAPDEELLIGTTWVEKEGNGFVAWDQAGHIARQVPFYSHLMLGHSIIDVEPFADASAKVHVPRDAIALFALATSDDSRNLLEAGAKANAPANMVFALVWEPIFAALSSTRADFLNLLHEENEVTLEAGWPVREGDVLTASGRVVGIIGQPGGRRIVVTSELMRGCDLVACLRSSFFIRDAAGEAGYEIRESYRAKFSLADQAACDFLTAQPWFKPTIPVTPGTTVTIDCRSFLDTCRNGQYTFAAEGEVAYDGVSTGEVILTPDEAPADCKQHPVVQACRLLGAGAGDVVPVAVPRDLGRNVMQAPSDMRLYARASGDFNPLHIAPQFARFAGLDSPIVHGMWTASTAVHRAIRLAAGGDANRITKLQTRFLSPVNLGEHLAVTARHVGMRFGQRVVEIEASAVHGTELTPVLSGEVSIRAPRTAYVFPGQGVQCREMGMTSYARSAAAKTVWDQAEEVCREHLGFSLLRVVRENPRELLVQGTTLRHPDGVLFLTQFTQVALAVTAMAQVSELKERGVFVDEAMFCGHSVGEYSALAAIAEVLSLPAVVDVVYNRGRTMDGLVTRDAQGRSPFGMGVVRPQYADMTDSDVQDLVTQVREETLRPLEIVNYNIRGKQYAATGDIHALRQLNAILAERQAAAGSTKPAYVDVPGIDVPFHSTLLLGGVPKFRETLESCLPPVVDPQLLVGRYIPNLVGRPFSLEREFVEMVHEASKSPGLLRLLADWESWRERERAGSLARTLLVELLAYQFASPVRWIETQDLLFDGPAAIEQLIEIGLAEQPVLSNMAHATLAQQPYRINEIRVLNSEAHFEELSGPTHNIEMDALPEAPKPSVGQARPPSAAAVVASVGETVSADPEIAGSTVNTSSHTDASSLTDAAPSAAECLHVLLALQTKLRPDQISERETLDELLGGNSARRNQVLADIGAEFGISAIDGAHDLPLGELGRRLSARATTYVAPGRYLNMSLDQCLATTFGAMRLQRTDIIEYLSREWAMGPGRALSVVLRLPLYVRDGNSARGGALSDLCSTGLANRHAAETWIDDAVAAYGREVGLILNKPAAAVAGPDARVDAAALDALSEQLFGKDGVFPKTAEIWQAQAGIDVYAGRAVGKPMGSADHGRLVAHEREHNAEYEAAIAGCFDADKHLAFTSSWAWIRREVFALAQRLALGEAVDTSEVTALASRLDCEARRAAKALASVARREGRALHAEVLEGLVCKTQDSALYVPRFAPTVPRLERRQDDQWRTTSAARPAEDDPITFARAVCTGDSPSALVGHVSAAEPIFLQDLLVDVCKTGLSFAGRTALVTGAGPGSIALEMVKGLLEGGARVIVTTSSFGPERSAFFKSIYQMHASPDAELHVVPANQGSFSDIDALVQWITSPRYEAVGAIETQLKGAYIPDIVVPFGALGEVAFLTGQGAKSQAVLRVLLLGVERLLARLADAYRDNAIGDRRLHVVLPLSPNHGVFGGDGVYGESKAALETLLNKWTAEQSVWGRFTSLVGARIGWVRGTGLMSANDVLAARVEIETNLRTFATEEMGFLLTALCGDSVRQAAMHEPLIAELTGGLDGISGLAERIGAIRDDLANSATLERRRQELGLAFDEALGTTPRATVMVRPRISHRVSVPIPTPGELAAMPELDHLDPDRVVVIVGYGEVSPLGSARTRWSIERTGTLSLEGVAELAWMMGLIRPEAEGTGWEDVESGESVDDLDLKARYEDVVMSHSGVRFTDAGVAHFDPDAVMGLLEVHLEQDMSFTAPTRLHAEELRDADPENTLVLEDNGTFTVVRKRGAKVHVPRALKLLRNFAGQVPSGWDATRYGIPSQLVDQVDRTTVFNLVATVEAFVQAGMTPEEIYNFIHPSRVGSTQGSGIGGVTKLQRLYRDWYDGTPRQTDAVQETLINVIAGYVVQSYLGSYGPISTPVGACATAAISVQSGVQLIQQREADLVVTGGVDDFNVEGVIGFSDMSATYGTETMERFGLTPRTVSRPNDRRRRGFVESQGAGAIILCRANLAIEAGLPVYGIVAYAGSFTDGINRSVPAPGVGALSCAAEVIAVDRNPHDACDLLGRRKAIRDLEDKAAALCDLVGTATANQMVHAAVQELAHDFYRDSTSISPLRGALAVFGIGPDDIVVASKHDTGTQANDVNENRLHHMLHTHMGRTPGLPLAVISQKSLTGHPKGAAAAWQLNGLMQAMADGVVPGNQNLDDVDPAMADFTTLVFSDREIAIGSGRLRAGLVTSLGFGHVGALIALVHPFYFWRMLKDTELAAYSHRLTKRTDTASRTLSNVLTGRRRLVNVRTERPFAGKEGSAEHIRLEAEMLLDTSPRLRPGPASRTGQSCS